MFGAIWSALFASLVEDVVEVLLVAAVDAVVVVMLEVAAMAFFFGVTTQFCVLSSEAVADIVTIFFVVSVLLSPSSMSFLSSLDPLPIRSKWKEKEKASVAV